MLLITKQSIKYDIKTKACTRTLLNPIYRLVFIYRPQMRRINTFTYVYPMFALL